MLKSVITAWCVACVVPRRHLYSQGPPSSIAAVEQFSDRSHPGRMLSMSFGMLELSLLFTSLRNLCVRRGSSSCCKSGVDSCTTNMGERVDLLGAKNTIEESTWRFQQAIASLKEKGWRPRIPEISLPNLGLSGRLNKLQASFATSYDDKNAPKIDAEQFVKDATSSSGGWVLKVDREDGIRVWRRHVFGSRTSEIRGNGILMASPSDVDALMQCSDERIIRQYNPLYHSGYDLEKVDKETRVSYGRARSIIPPFKPRDTVTRVAHRKLKDGSSVLILHAVAHSNAPRDNGCVRARIMRGMYLMQPIANQPTRTNLTYTMHIDVGALAPRWLMNKVITKDAVQLVQRLSKTSKAWQANRICVDESVIL